MRESEPTPIRHFIRSALLRADLLRDGYIIVSESRLPDGRHVTHLRHQRTGRRLRLEVTETITTLYHGDEVATQLGANSSTSKT